jgi:hypothetical protein
MSLEEEGNDWSNFRIISMDNSKRLGDPVLYSDQIGVVSSKDRSYWFNITESSLYHFQIGLEVNAFEEGVPLKINNYLAGD